jgi:hypothetical protein
VAARGDQAEERRLDRIGGEEVGRHVALQVVDRRQRKPARSRQPLGRRDPDQQRADEPRPLRHRDERDVVEPASRLPQRVVDDRVDQLEMVPRRDLRHDPAEAVVHALRGDDRRAHLAVAGDDRRARVVARGLEREDQVGEAFGTSSSEPRSVAGVRHITTASSPLSA